MKLIYKLLYNIIVGIESLFNKITVNLRNILIRKEGKMKINDFAVKIAGLEGGKKQVSIAQIKEILKIVNGLLDGQVYKLIKGCKEE